MRYATFIFILLFSGCDLDDTNTEKPNLEKLHAILNGEAEKNREGVANGLSQQIESDWVSLHGKNETPYYTVGRKKAVGSDSCAECHEEQHQRQFSPNGKPIKAHWNISLKHAGQEIMNCATCHGTSDKTVLQTLEGAAVSFDRPDRVCAQCHSDQVRDWKNSAHGKSAAGWMPPRVLKNCTECHNPHRPAFASRYPSRLMEVTDPPH